MWCPKYRRKILTNGIDTRLKELLLEYAANISVDIMEMENEMYMGTFVYGKYRVKAVGSKQKKLLPQNEWKRIPNHHEPIVIKEEFEQVQSMKSAKLEQFTFHGQRSSVYVGRVHCECCGRNMCYKKDRIGKEFFH